MTLHKQIQSCGHVAIFYVLTKLFSFFLVSVITTGFLGHHLWTFFSASGCVKPLIGAFGGSFGALIFFVINFFGLFFAKNSFSLHLLAHHIPGFCAALSWTMQKNRFRALFFLCCAVLFLMHPVGGKAGIYVLLWCIPTFLCFVKRHAIFFEAVISTSIAHAIGSVIWLYTVPSHASEWVSLIPLAFVERLFFAIGMTCMYYLYQKGIFVVKKSVTSDSKASALSINSQ